METSTNDLKRGLSRRDFLSRLAIIAGGSAVALACGSEATAISPTATNAPGPTSRPTTVPTSAPTTATGTSDSIEAGPVEFYGNGARLLGYLSRPTLPGPHPAVVVVHENRGLLPHFEDVTRRYAREGYVALAIDMLSREGGAGAFTDSSAMLTALRSVPTDQVVADGNAAVSFLQDQSYVRPDRVGATGFCFGGGIVWLMAVGNPELRAAVPFYGSAPPLEDVPNLQTPVLGIYAGEDSRINAGVSGLEDALKSENKDFKFVTYPGANHAFFNDTGSRYNPQAAEGAWMETLDWFEDHLMDTQN